MSNATLEDLAILTQQQIGGRGFLGMDGGTQGIPGATPVEYVNQKPWIAPPDGSIPIIVSVSGALGIIGTTLTLTIISLPEGFDAAINAISANITGGGFQDASGDLLWSFLIDNRPIEGLDSLNTQRGSPSVPLPIAAIRLRGGQTLTGKCNHVANGALAGSVIMGVLGYKYPRLATE